jgi:hypothetical protein
MYYFLMTQIFKIKYKKFDFGTRQLFAHVNMRSAHINMCQTHAHVRPPQSNSLPWRHLFLEMIIQTEPQVFKFLD